MEDYIVLDLETTGLSCNKGAEIIEIGVTEINSGVIGKNYSRLVKPKMGIPENIAELTHIDNDMVKDAKSIEEVLPRLREFIGDKTVICHNAKFDIKFLNFYLDKLGLKPLKKYICTLEMLKNTQSYRGTNNKLGTACQYYNIKLINAHRAYADTYATAQLFLILQKEENNSLL